ncbi:hypothetical protein BsWGS_03094 [Bradybaena similaris]
MKPDINCIDDLVVISDEDSDSEVEFLDRTFNTEPAINRGQPDLSGEHEDKIPDSNQCSFGYLQPYAETVYEDEVIEIRVNYQHGDKNNIASTATSSQESYGVEEMEAAGDAELGIDRNELFMDSFNCHPVRVDIWDVSYLMGLPNKASEKETDTLVYVNEKNGDESIRKKSKQKNICGQEFASFSDAYNSQFTNFSDHRKHKQIINKETRSQCQDCGFTCSTIQTLSRHKLIHTEGKRYKCDICGKGFKHSSYLPTHKRIHTGEKPYKCDVCGKGFNYRGYLSTHKRIHTGEKPYKCDICGKEFNYSGYLSTHKRIHTGQKPYKCDTCGLEFTDHSSFGRHRNCHSGKKPYRCDTWKGFSRQDNRITHKRMNTGENAYRCTWCGLQCIDYNDLRRHDKCIHVRHADVMFVEKAFSTSRC